MTHIDKNRLSATSLTHTQNAPAAFKESIKRQNHWLELGILSGLILVSAYLLKSVSSESSQLQNFPQKLALMALTLGTLFYAGKKFLRDFRPTHRDLLLMSGLLVLSILVVRSGLLFIETSTKYLPAVDTKNWVYGLPFAFGAMMVQMVLNGSCAMIFSLMLGCLAAMLFGFDFTVGWYALLSSLYGAYIVEKFETRTGLFKAALFVALFNLLIVMLAGKFIGGMKIAPQPIHLTLLVALVSAISHFLVLSLLTPVVEHLDYVTDMKLVELANFNNPLLNKLALEAPGTYHHSRVVAQLVESAAESIGANPLLAMVSALYHDIGKTKAPQYFTENQTEETRSIHDRIKPSMSKMIVIAHVKDGIDMARRAGLPQAIINAIPEHHGTALITFFYHKAKDQEDPELGVIDEKDYRYPGPKPQSKETALLMLADSVEATTKSLSDPTSEKIQSVIQKTVNKYFADGQLNECDLTLKDLNKIAKSFHRTLSSVYKPRVEYPEVIPSSGGKQKVKKDASRNQQSSKDAESESPEGEDDDSEDLKRLGL